MLVAGSSSLSDLQLYVGDFVCADNIPCTGVDDFHHDGSATFGLQCIPRQVLGTKTACASAMLCLLAQLTVWTQTADAPAQEHGASF